MSTFDEHHLDAPLSPNHEMSSDSDSSDDAGRNEGMNPKRGISSSSSDSDSGLGDGHVQ